MKIYIIGIVASGKTTLAKQLAEQLKSDWFELDTIVHHNTDKGRIKRSPEEQVEIIKSINNKDSWIIEGTYRNSCHILLDIADRVIFLDTPLRLRRYRIITRFVKQQLGLEKCHYKSNLYMLKLMFKWTRDFENDRKEFEIMLSNYSTKLIRLNGSESLETVCDFI